MKPGLFAALLLSFVLGVGAAVLKLPNADPPNFNYWSAKELKGYEKQLHEKVAGPYKIFSVKLADYGSSNVAITRREANGIPEVHARMDDYFVVESGEATLVIGGEVVNAKQVEPGETRGDSIKGGERRKLTTGDVVHIPTDLPHQLLVDNGKLFTYFVIKVKAK